MPALTRGWHLMTRAAIPKDKMPLVTSLIKADTDVDKVKTALLELFGPDQVADPRDIAAVKRKMNPAAADEGYLVDDDDYDWWYEDDVYEEGYAADSWNWCESGWPDYDYDYVAYYQYGGDEAWYDDGYVADGDDVDEKEIPPNWRSCGERLRRPWLATRRAETR